MPPDTQRPRSAAVITVSDSCAAGTRDDLSGPAIARELSESGFAVTERRTLPDDQPTIEDALRTMATRCALVVTTGGTGIAARDVTPEATRAVCTRLLDGLAERMRAEGIQETPFAVLSRGVAGQLGTALVVNLPGSPRGAVTSLRAILPVLGHAVDLLHNPAAPHPQVEAERKA